MREFSRKYFSGDESSFRIPRIGSADLWRTICSLALIVLMLSSQAAFAFSLSNVSAAQNTTSNLLGDNSVQSLLSQLKMKDSDKKSLEAQLNKALSPANSAPSSTTLSANQTSALNSVSLPFIQNQGQTDQKVKFYANTFAGTVSVTSDGVTYGLTKASKNSTDINSALPAVRGIAVQERFVNAGQLAISGADKSSAAASYFVGSDSTKWHSNLPTFNTVSLGYVWSGIKVDLKAHGNNVEKLFYVAPGADVSQIKLALQGISGLSINENGELVMATPLGPVSMTKPVAYQDINGQREYVGITYVILPGKNSSTTAYGFAIDRSMYNPSYPLTIDPLLASTYLGGASSESLSSYRLLR